MPITLTPADITHMQRELGFAIPLEITDTITGHIDVLQIRNGSIHVMGYVQSSCKKLHA